jgi:hypothetical protein
LIWFGFSLGDPLDRLYRRFFLGLWLLDWLGFGHRFRLGFARCLFSRLWYRLGGGLYLRLLHRFGFRFGRSFFSRLWL